MQDDIKQWFQEIDSYTALHGQPHLAAADENDKGAVEIAKLLIQSLLLLHGGALLAIPAYVSILPGLSQFFLVLLLGCFSFGLLTALAAGLLAFFALAERSDGHSKLREAVDHRASARAAHLRFLIMQKHVFEEAEAKSIAAAVAIENSAQPHFKRYLRMRWWGIISVCSSIAALLVASWTPPETGH